ncbi:MAG: hypothetical protein J6W66_05895 [Lachnospiraceae bacterium]|nr:hypothetical protein [Lachnospiraceae bacterium]
MARILNLVIVLFEILAFAKSLSKKASGRRWSGLAYYTQISNLIAMLSSLLLVIFGQKPFVEVIRYLGVSMLVMTFFVTVCILVPMGGGIKRLLFSGSGLFHHLICPILSTLSYLFAEDRAPLYWIWLPAVVTLAYGLIMVGLNAKGKVDGPYPFFQVRRQGVKATVLWMVGLLAATCLLSFGVGYKKPVQTDIQYIFVHGLSGWGSYDFQNEFLPYWGLTGGSVIRYLNNVGYESVSASVDPTGSAWDRACELYAQLTGTRVDYGAEHSARCHHERFGRDYSKEPLLKDFGKSRFVLIGHSFGGVTVRLFSEILRNGSEAERAYTNDEDLSDFFRGGGGDQLFALVTLAAPTNGTTAYDLYEDESFDPAKVSFPEEYEKNSDAVSSATKAEQDGRIQEDYAAFDMHIDNALAINEKITTFEDVYYFAVPYTATKKDENGELWPDPERMEGMFLKGSVIMSRYTGKTKGGFVLDETWQSNDGLVNEVSARAPFGAPSEDYDGQNQMKPGIWYVFPTRFGDHMAPQGGLTKRVDVKPFYKDLVKMLAGLEQP